MKSWKFQRKSFENIQSSFSKCITLFLITTKLMQLMCVQLAIFTWLSASLLESGRWTILNRLYCWSQGLFTTQIILGTITRILLTLEIFWLWRITISRFLRIITLLLLLTQCFEMRVPVFMRTLTFRDSKQWERTWSILCFQQTWQSTSMILMKWRNDWLQWTFSQVIQKTRKQLWIGWSIWRTSRTQQNLGKFAIVGLICSL